mmetsp:Transcript_29947/g.62598  ORF Transcript_29947/g.62598 Transcript_29947/m.62598 type:complete len:81 (-) Transcript_29947:552-794(-)
MFMRSESEISGGREQERERGKLYNKPSWIIDRTNQQNVEGRICAQCWMLSILESGIVGREGGEWEHWAMKKKDSFLYSSM